jgi:Cu/Zn superoxide dismutase
VLYASGHYKLDPTIDVTDEYNELWPEILPAGGIVSTSLTHPTHALREDAQAVVLHRGTPKVACADLTRESYVGLKTSGTFYNLADADTKGLTVSGTAELYRRFDGTTVVEVDLTGLPPSAEHPVHVHDKPCDVEYGGGHYVIDAAGPEGEDNEIWPSVTANANGAGSRAIAVSHLARADAQSLVVHDGADAARLACVDLY